ncbi:MAG: hypothetical protein Q9183_006790, partial [Haloplaca sp. 2 TL-2023]
NENGNDGAESSGGEVHKEENKDGSGDEFRDSQEKESDQGDQDSLTSSSGARSSILEKEEQKIQEREAWRALMHDSTELIELLLTNGAKADAKNRDGKTPLSLAREEGFDKIVAFLEEHLARQG